MESSTYRIRRATLDDLGALKATWASMRYRVDDLEKRLTEFQVAVDANGQIAGSLGFTTHKRHALIHSEAFDNFGLADEVRPLFWQRIQGLAMNHGIVRLWMNDQATFWTRSGFQPAGDDLQKLPPALGDSGSTWFTLKLKDEDAINSLDKEVTLMMEAERRRTASTMETAKTLKTAVTIIAFVLALAVLGAAAYVYLSRERIVIPPQ